MAREEKRTAERVGSQEERDDREEEGRGEQTGSRGRGFRKGQREGVGGRRAGTDPGWGWGDETKEISKDKKRGKEHQRRYEKGEERTERETEKHGGLVSTSPGGSLSPSPVGHPSPSSTHRGKKGGRPFPAGQRLASLCLM